MPTAECGTPLENLERFEAVIIVTDHPDYDYRWIVEHARLIIDSRNATRAIRSSKIVRC